MAHFGDRLRLAMTHAKVGLDELAEAAHMHPQTVSRWRQQEDVPRDRHRLQLAANALGVDLEWLSTGRPVKGGRPFPVGFSGEEPSLPRVIRETLNPDKKLTQDPPPAPSFVEHVLFTAGRIAELANQIAYAAEKQLAASEDLGRRSQEEMGARAPVAHHAPAKAPSKKAKRSNPRGGA